MEMVKLKCWEAGHAEKHKICWKTCFVVTWWFFFDGNGETYMKCWEADHAEKQFFFVEKHVLLWHEVFWWKKTWIIDVWLGNIQETPKLELKGMADLFFVYIYMTPWKRFLVVFFCADKQYFAEKQLLCWEALKNKPNSKCHEYHLSNHSMSPTPGMLNKNFKICFNCRFNLHDMNPCRIQSCNYWIL